MRIYVTLPALAFGAILAFNTGTAQAGRFFGAAKNNGGESVYQDRRSTNSFDFGPGPSYPIQQQPTSRHRLFRRNPGVPNAGMPTYAPGYGMPAGVVPGYGMPANVMQGYGMPTVNGVPLQAMQAPVMQPPFIRSPFQTPPVHMTTATPVPVAPAVQSRLVPIPAPRMQPGPTTAEPPLANPR